MNIKEPSREGIVHRDNTSAGLHPFTAPLAAGILAWIAISLGFWGLKLLMRERPEFVGPPLRSTKTELVQQAPSIVMRSLSDDISAVKAMQPTFTEVRFDMVGGRDYRGLRTISDMFGGCRAQYILTNSLEEPVFVLFKCPHPQSGDPARESLQAATLKMDAPTDGVREDTREAWMWSGTLQPHASAKIEISYQVSSLNRLTYRVAAQNGAPVSHLRVVFNRQELNSTFFESADGRIPAAEGSNEPVTWERRDFLAPAFFSASITEGRNLYTSLMQLLDIGPLISLLFLLAVSAVILTRQPLTVIQMLTLSAGYALYFPLVLYLSANFRFAVAIVLAAVIPGALLLNYARWLLGARLGIVGGTAFLALYQVFPTLAVFLDWRRGLVLLCLGVVTLWVLINLQNQALRRRAVMAAAILLGLLPPNISAADIQLLVPGELGVKLLGSTNAPMPALLSFEPASYTVRQRATHFEVESALPFQILRTNEIPTPLFGAPVHLTQSRVESSEADVARLVTISNRLALFTQRPGAGTLRLSYRVPIETREGKRRAQIPVLLGASGNVRLESPHNQIEVVSGSLWMRTAAERTTVYEIGVAGEASLIVEWREQDGGGAAFSGTAATGGRDFYGIGLTRAQNLTVVNSDGSCTHFGEFELPAQQAEEFRLRLPARAKLISVSVNGTEISAPPLEDQTCRIRLPAREPQQTAHRLSFRLAYPPVKLGFIGQAELHLPEVFQTVGTLEWVVALPSGFETQVIASALETQKVSPDLSRFGDYGRILKSHAHTYLAKDLAPPGLVSLSLRYRQVVAGIYETRRE